MQFFNLQISCFYFGKWTETKGRRKIADYKIAIINLTFMLTAFLAEVYCFVVMCSGHVVKFGKGDGGGGRFRSLFEGEYSNLERKMGRGRFRSL